MVMANCLYICPAKPPMNATGINTAHSTNTIAITGPVTSCMALNVAWAGARPSSSIIRSTFSNTTIASSTTIPMASTMPNKVKVLIEKPSKYIPANVPTIETGTAKHGISVARQFCKNKYTTKNTNTMASARVLITSSIEILTKRVVS